MNQYEDMRASYLEKGRLLKEELQSRMPDIVYIQAIEDFLEDLQNETRTVVFLGEFKRGKSTLVNALLQESILPSDVTPTTAFVHVIRYGAEQKLVLHYNDGMREEVKWEKDVLSSFTYETMGEKRKSIQYLEISLPSTRLDQNLVLVDTPGVGDLNEHQLEVTYSYIPRSDLVVFVFDATAPIRRSELEYLSDSVLKLRTGQVLFLANFQDRVDSGEREEVMEYMERKLRKVMGDSPFSLYPISAKEGLQGKASSGVERVWDLVQEVLHAGWKVDQTCRFYENRWNALMQLVEENLKHLQEIQEMNEQELQKETSKIADFMRESEKRKERLRHYVHQRRDDMMAIIRKSLDYFEERLIDELYDEIDAFAGYGFDKFVGNRLPVMVKRRTNQWLNDYTPRIEVMFQKLEEEIIQGLARSFQQQSRRWNVQVHLSLHQNTKIDILGDGLSSNPMLKTGAILGGAGIVLGLLGGGLLLPVLTLVGLPFLNQMLGERRLDQDKQMIKPEVGRAIRESMTALEGSLAQYVDQKIERIMNEALQSFDDCVERYHHQLKQEMETRHNTQARHLMDRTCLQEMQEVVAKLSTC